MGRGVVNGKWWNEEMGRPLLLVHRSRVSWPVMLGVFCCYLLEITTAVARGSKRDKASVGQDGLF